MNVWWQQWRSNSYLWCELGYLLSCHRILASDIYGYWLNDEMIEECSMDRDDTYYGQFNDLLVIY